LKKYYVNEFFVILTSWDWDTADLGIDDWWKWPGSRYLASLDWLH